MWYHFKVEGSNKIFVVKVTDVMMSCACLGEAQAPIWSDACITAHNLLYTSGMLAFQHMHTRCVTGVCLLGRFQSERESGDRNFAIGYYLKEKKVRVAE